MQMDALLLYLEMQQRKIVDYDGNESAPPLE